MTGEPIPIVVDSRVRLPLARLPAEIVEKLKAEFTHKNPDHAKQVRENAARARRYHHKRTFAVDAPEHEPTWREEVHAYEELTFPRGGARKVLDVLAAAGVVVRVHDRRTLGALGPRPSRPFALQGMTAARFQEEATASAIAKENCIVRAPTGSGKTLIAEMVIARLGLCALVLVQTKELFDQWVRRLRTELGLRDDEIGIIKGSKRRVAPVTVAMVQTFAKHAESFRGWFGVAIFDEVQRAAASTFFPAIDACDARYRIGISADEKRKDGKEYLIYDAFGSVAYEVDRATLERDRFVLPVEVRLIPTEFEATWYVDLPNEQKLLPENFNRLLGELTRDEARNETAARIAKEEARAGHTVLVFSHRVEHCASLRSKILMDGEERVGVFVGDKLYERESEATSRGLREGTTRVACGTYQSIGTGVDVPAADRGIATTPIHSNKQGFGQNRGRLCRIDRGLGATKTDAVFHVLWDRKVFGLSPLRNLLRWNDGNVRVLDPETNEFVPGRAYLRREEDREDAEKIRRVL